MSWKKNVFSYFIWLAYTLMTGMVLVCLFIGKTGDMAKGLLYTAAALALTGILVFLLHRFAPKYSVCQGEKHTIRNVMEAAVAVVLLAIGLVLRIRGIDEAGQTVAYFEIAQVSSGQSIPQIAHGAVYFYVQILHTIFYFLGNKFIAGIGFQMVLMYGAALILYYSMRHLSGHIAALVTLAFVMCSPYMVEGTLILSPEIFYLLFFMTALTWVVSKHMVRLRPYEFLFFGIITGVLTNMDIAGLLLFFLAIAVIFAIRAEQPGLGKKVSALLLCLLGLLAGYASCIFADAYISGKRAEGVLHAWINLYHPEEFSLPVTYSGSDSLTECLLLFGLLALGIFSFWRDNKKDYMKAYTIGICIVLAASFYGVFTEEMPGNLWVFLLLAILAGISVEECFRELPQQSGKNQMSVKMEFVETESLETESFEMESLETESLETEYARTDSEEKMEIKKETKINYIENPLPLPKKHEKRVLDYDKTKNKEVDDFDLEISDDDDFDI